MHITPFGGNSFHLITLMAISMAESLVANKFILYCIKIYTMVAAQESKFRDILNSDRACLRCSITSLQSSLLHSLL